MAKCDFYWVHITKDHRSGLLFFTKAEAEEHLATVSQRSLKGDRWGITVEIREETDASKFEGYSDSNSEPIPTNCIY